VELFLISVPLQVHFAKFGCFRGNRRQRSGGDAEWKWLAPGATRGILFIGSLFPRVILANCPDVCFNLAAFCFSVELEYIVTKTR